LARGFEEFMNNKDLKKIGQKYNKSIAQISLRYLMQKGMIILPKSKN
jgi:2,5-diketo-D-gluconate reductase A